ncbi:MAG: Gfo/Idh/MocA family oxidoreductase [Rhodobacteraceae bacterium]|nr:Gfo/Idh/MocA family oxidoreductase [Paracoccaceae bacterium]
MTIGIAVIGAGIMGADHARIVAEDLPGASLRVICDMDAARARGLADRLGAADAVTDPEAAIVRADIDAVIVASPDPTHAPLTLACIRMGKPVLCEKPLSPSPDECVAVMRAEAAAGRRLVQVGFMRRFDAAYGEMRRALTEGRLGRALMMHNLHRNVATPAADFTGAMAITNSAPHEFDIARHVLGTEITGITACQPRRSDALVAPVVMVLDTADGQVVTVEVNNNAAYGYDVRAELVGETASLSLATPARTRLDGGLASSTAYDADWRGRFAAAYAAQDRAFLHFAATGDFPEGGASAWDGYAAAQVAATGVRALAEGGRMPVALIAKPEFYA